MSRFLSRRAMSLLAVPLLGMLIAFPLGVLASHQFTDVPDSNTYHADIDALADAGVTTGCGNGTTYCPSDNVTREQMAAFMNRLGALGAGKTPVANATKLDGLDSSQFLRADQNAVGVHGCAGTALSPSVPTFASGNFSMYSSGATDVTFRCSLALPDAAIVTSVVWSVSDTSATESVGCDMYRYRQDLILDTYDYDIMASGATTAGGVGALTELTDASVTEAVVDNGTYWYVAECTPTATGSTTSVSGIRVHYLLAGLPLT